MRRLRNALAALLLPLLLAGALPSIALAANPFTGRQPSPPPAAAPAPGSGGMAPSGLFAPVTYFMLGLQREITRQISRQMRAIRDGESRTALLLAAAIGFLYGAVHTLGPGHGKLVVISYFLSRDARPWRGFLMGGQIALFHVVSAVVLLWLVDMFARRIFGMPAGEIRAIQQASYASIALIGLYMLGRPLRSLMRGEEPLGHSHGESHHHHQSHGGLGQEGLLSFFVGLVPCTGAIVVMLYALANGIVLAGVLVVASIGVGMAITMAALGLLGMVARRLVLSGLEARSGGGRWIGGALELAGGLAITAVGASFLLSVL